MYRSLAVVCCLLAVECSPKVDEEELANQIASQEHENEIAKFRWATLKIEMLEDACRMYKLKTAKFPAKLDDLYTMPSGMTQVQWGGPYLKDPVPKDLWRRPFRYKAMEETDQVEISSAGPDGEFGTDDDISGGR